MTIHARQKEEKTKVAIYVYIFYITESQFHSLVIT